MSTIKDQEKYERWNKDAFRLLHEGLMGRFWAGQSEVAGSPEDVAGWIGIADMLIGKLEEGKERLLDGIVNEEIT